MLCSNCNDEGTPAEEVRLVLDTKEIDIALCKPCREAFEAQGWITVVDEKREHTAT